MCTEKSTVNRHIPEKCNNRTKLANIIQYNIINAVTCVMETLMTTGLYQGTHEVIPRAPDTDVTL